MLDKVRSFAGFMAIAGVVSSALSLADYNLRILMWVDMWGEAVGWVIRGGLVVIGVAGFFLLPATSDSESAADTP